MLSIISDIGTINIDASIQEDHTTEVTKTEHPVEKGANITDHVEIRPDTLSVEGVVSDAPLREDVISTSGASRSVDAFTRLQNIQKEKLLVTVVTGLKTYTNMILRTLSPVRNAKTGKALRFNARFEEVRIVESDVAFIPVAQEASQDLAQKKQPTGRQQSVIPTGAQDEKSSSILFNFGESVGLVTQ